MKLEFWGDIVCSWCGIANERVNEALSRFDGDVELVHRSFRLMGDMPDGESHDFVDYMSRRRGIDPAEARQMAERVEMIARRDGIENYHVHDNSIGNTTLAHEFLAYASEQGLHREAWDLVFRANFGEKADIWTIDDLAAFAEPLGLDETAVREALESRRYRAQVEADHAEALALGSQGVPFLVIDRTYGMSGAQSVTAIVNALETAAAAREQVTA